MQEESSFLAGETVPPMTVVAAVAETTGVPVKEIMGPDRHKSIAFARHVAMYLVRHDCYLISYPEVGRLIGDRNHATVMSAVRKIQRRSSEDATVLGILATARAKYRRESPRPA